MKLQYIVDAKEMAAIDDYSINTLGIPQMVLMERAALSVYELAKEYLDKLSELSAFKNIDKEYEEYLKENEKSELTIEKYLRDLSHFISCYLVNANITNTFAIFA